MDVAALQPGRDFRKAIDASLASCSLLLAIIGPDWLNLREAQGARRLDDPADFVRIELASALQRDIPVVPVLVRGAKMPQAEQLPECLKELAFRNAVELTHARWKSDVQVLFQALRPHLDPPATTPLAVSQSAASQQQPPSQPALTQSVSGPPIATANASTLDPDALDRVSSYLAVYIGPIAHIVVKRLAKRCSSLDELYTIAAGEIENESDRRIFLRSRRP